MTFHTGVIYHTPLDQAMSAVSLTRRMTSSTSAHQFPQENEKIIIKAGTPYVHVTTTDRWTNVDTDKYVHRVKGNVSALGKGFYTYPASEINTTNAESLSTLLQWLHFNARDEKEMRTELEKVRIVTVRPKYNVRAWEPNKLPQGEEITKMEDTLSAQRKLDFLAIVDSSHSREAAWLKAEIKPEILPGMTIPTDRPVKVKIAIELKEDGLPMKWLVKSVRPLTENEVELYVEHIWEAHSNMTPTGISNTFKSDQITN